MHNKNQDYMSLLDKTRTELINIILRKDDVEKRLMDKVKLLEKEKKQLIEDSEKMKRTRKMSRIICLILIFLNVVSFVTLTCNCLK